MIKSSKSVKNIYRRGIICDDQKSSKSVKNIKHL